MKKIYLSKNAHPRLTAYLKEQGYRIHPVSGSGRVEGSIASHPDLYLCKLGAAEDAPLFRGDPALPASPYPGDVRYNAACTGSFFIHNLNYTDPALLCRIRSLGIPEIHVRQGYTKCSLAVIDEKAVITSDKGIAKALAPYGLDVLLIEKGHILLPGFDYGFIGGTCGRLGQEIVFNGNLAAHPDFRRITDFISARGLKTRYFPEYPLEDIGSILAADPESIQTEQERL